MAGPSLRDLAAAAAAAAASASASATAQARAAQDVVDALTRQEVIQNKMNLAMGDSLSVSADLKRSLEKLVDPLDKSKKLLKEMKNSVMETVDGLDASVESFEQMNQVAKQLGRLDKDALESQADSQALLGKVKEGYEKLLVLKKDDAKAVRLINSQLDLTNDAITVATTGVGDIEKAFQEVKNGAIKVGNEIKKFDLDKPTSAMEDFGESIGGALKGLKHLDNFGFKGLFGNLAAMHDQVKQLKNTAEEDSKKRMQTVGKLGMTGARDAGELLRSTDDTKRRQGFQSFATHYAGLGTNAEKDAMVRQMSGKTGLVSGRLDRYLAKKVLASGGTGMIGEAGMKMMSMGGGSIMGGAAMSVAGPLAAITAILQVLQKGFDRNKEVYTKLGGGGLVMGGGRNLRDSYEGWNSALTSRGPGFSKGTGAGAYFGMNFEKATDAMQAVVESGQAIQTQFGGIHKGRNIDEAITGGRATDTYTGIMRNAAMFGGNIGMDSTQAAKESMKMMHDFNLSMGEVEDMFIGINLAVKSTGISTTRYLQLIDGITSQFDKFNKSLNFTVALIATLGKNATYTAEDLQGMVQGLMGNKKGLELSTFAYQQLGGKGMRTEAEGMTQKAMASGEELKTNEAFKGRNVEGMTAADILAAIPKGDTSTASVAQRYINERTRARAMSSAAKRGDALGMASIEKNMGETPETQIIKNLSMLNTSIKTSGGKGLMDFQQGTKGQEASVQNLMKSPLFAQLSEFLGVDTQTTSKYMTQAMSQFGEQFKTMAAGGEEGAAAQKQLGLTGPKGEATVARMKEEMAKTPGLTAEKTNAFKEWFETGGMAALVSSLTDQQRKDAEGLADKNRKYITGPLDYIQKALGSLVENIIRLLSTLATYTSWAMGKSDKDELEDKQTIVSGMENNGQTMEGLNDILKKLEGAKGDHVEEVRTVVQQAQGMLKEVHDPKYVEKGDLAKLQGTLGYIQTLRETVGQAKTTGQDLNTAIGSSLTNPNNLKDNLIPGLFSDRATIAQHKITAAQADKDQKAVDKGNTEVGPMSISSAQEEADKAAKAVKSGKAGRGVETPAPTAPTEAAKAAPEPDTRVPEGGLGTVGSSSSTTYNYRSVVVGVSELSTGIPVNSAGTTARPKPAGKQP